MRVATVDIGTNSVLLLVAERRPDGVLSAVEERATITRLGEGVDRTRALAPEAVARTNACLDTYASIVRSAGVERVAVVGTSAMRDASGSSAVREHVHLLFGVEGRVISGDEEARLTFAGSLSGLGYDQTSGDVAVYDVGGGSTEVVLGRLGSGGETGISYSKSFDVGSVRLTERHRPSDPPTPAQLSAIEAEARRAFADVPSLPSSVVPVGIAGTMTTLAAISLRLARYDGSRVHGHVMSAESLRGVVDGLSAMSLEARRETVGLEPKRADVIVAGGLVALALLEKLGARSVRISDRGVRWGLALALAAD